MNFIDHLQAAKLLGMGSPEAKTSKAIGSPISQMPKSKSWANSYLNFVSTIKERIDNYKEVRDYPIL